jgi:F-type H+-transporting ATPase subunit b
MSKAYPQKQSSGSPLPGVIIGVLLMVAGTWASTEVHHGIEALQKGETPHGPLAFLAQPLYGLEGQGIPIDPGKTLATIGVFLILFPVIKSFFLNPLTEAISQRNTDLERTFSEAEQLRTEMQQMRSSYEQQLATTQAEAREQIQSTIREAQNLRQTLMVEAAERADALVERAHQEIAQERDRVITDLRIQVTDLALNAAERVIGANMDTEANRRLVEDFINQVEVAR